MNTVLFFAGPTLLADIVPPPPPDSMAGPLGGSSLASLGFWTLAIVGAAGLSWLRRRRSKSLERTVEGAK